MTCSWPKCDADTGLLPFFRVADDEVFMHCGEHHVIVSRLARTR